MVNYYFSNKVILMIKTIMCDEKNILNVPVKESNNKKIQVLESGVELITDENDVKLEDVQNDQHCAPGKQYKDGVCFSLDNLYSLARAYNKYVISNGEKDKAIKFKYDINNKKSDNRKYLLKELSSALDGICKDKLCWLKQDFVKQMKRDEQNDIKYNTYRETGPKGRFTWLNTVNLDNVMTQYQNMYPDFYYLGTVPIDFDDLDEKHQYSNYDYNKLMKDGKYKFGVVFNLDFHYQSGSHWVALFADFKSGDIDFFDSYGEKPHERILKLMNSMKKTCDKNNIKCRIDWNKVQHQQGNSECGVYSINFIARRLAGQTLEDTSKERTDDNVVNQCRKVYFRNSS